MTATYRSAKAIRPVFRELTGRRTGSGWLRYFDDSELPGHILRSEGFTGSGARGLFELYEEMEQKDGHLFAVLQTRKNGVLSRPRKVVAASENERDREIARFVDNALKEIKGFDQSLLDILDALGKGLSVQEIMWRARGGRIVPDKLKSRAPGRFVFDEEGRPRLSSWDSLATLAPGEDATSGNGSGRTVFSRIPTGGRALPERKFVIFIFGGLYESPFGRGLCGRAYWFYWFKI